MLAWTSIAFAQTDQTVATSTPAADVPAAVEEETPPAAGTDTTATATAARAKPAILTGELEDVIVTAQRRTENLQKVPVSVATLSSEQIDVLRSAGDDVRFLAGRVPSLNIESSFGRTFPRFYIRGLGNTDFDLNASQPVLFILDDIVLENPVLKGFPIFDVDHIEVLRGPQGTLFGRNTPAGVVKVDTVKPKNTPEAYGRFTYGQFNFTGVEGVANVPIIKDVLKTRISLNYERRDGWVDNLFTGEEDALEGFRDAAGRFQLSFTPGDIFSALINVHAHSLSGTARVFRANILAPMKDGELVEGFDRGNVQQDGQNTQRVDQVGFTGTVQIDAGDVLLVSIFGYETLEAYSRGDIDGGFGAAFAGMNGPGVIPFPSESADGIPSLIQITEELRIASDAWKGFNFQAGIFIFREELEIESFSYDTLGGGVQNGFAEQKQVANSLGLYGQASYDFFEKLRLSGGLRWSDDKKDFSARRTQSPIGGGAIGPLTANPQDDVLSWDLSLSYVFTDNFSAYVRAAHSFRAPSIQGRVLFGDALSIAQSEKILSFEGGVKSELFNRRARINLTGFYYQLSDQQLTAVGGATNFNRLLNADKTVGYGFEADAQFLPLNNLFITIGTSFNHTKIDDDLTIVPCGAPCTVTDPMGATMGTVSIQGNPLPNAPKWIVNVTLRYGFPIHEEGEIFLFTDWAYRSRINFFLYESLEFADAEMLEGGLRIGYAMRDGSMELAGFIRNITDDTSATGGIDFNNLTGMVNEPRTWGVQGMFRF